MLRLWLILASAISLASAFQANAPPPRVAATSSTSTAVPDQCTTRRDVLQRTASSLGFLAIVSSGAADPANAAVIRSPGKCANGEGDGCDSLAEDNDLIRSLQQKSSDNREANQRVGNENIKGNFGFIGWAAVAVILNDLTSSFLEKQNNNDGES